MKKQKPIYSERWGNGAKIDVYFHNEIVGGYDESDRIELVITTEFGATPSLMMNAEDAIGIIHGLAMGIQRIIDNGITPKPK